MKTSGRGHGTQTDRQTDILLKCWNVVLLTWRTQQERRRVWRCTGMSVKCSLGGHRSCSWVCSSLDARCHQVNKKHFIILTATTNPEEAATQMWPDHTVGFSATPLVQLSSDQNTTVYYEIKKKKFCFKFWQDNHTVDTLILFFFLIAIRSTRVVIPTE
jgi:hypothetical protein